MNYTKHLTPPGIKSEWIVKLLIVLCNTVIHTLRRWARIQTDLSRFILYNCQSHSGWQGDLLWCISPTLITQVAENNSSGCWAGKKHMCQRRTTCAPADDAQILQISRKTQMIQGLAAACDVASEVTGRESGDPLCGRHQAAGRLATSSTRVDWVGDGRGCWERSEGAVGHGGRWKTSRRWSWAALYLSPSNMRATSKSPTFDVSHGASPRRCMRTGDVTWAARTRQHLLGCDDDMQTFPWCGRWKGCGRLGSVSTAPSLHSMANIRHRRRVVVRTFACTQMCARWMLDRVIDKDIRPLPGVTSSTPEPMGHPVSINSR